MELSQAKRTDGYRDIKPLVETQRLFDQGVDSSKAASQMERIKMELERNLEEFKIKMSHRLHEIEQRILDISKKQNEIVNMVNAKRREARLSEGRSSLFVKETFEPQGPILIEDRPRFEDRYSTPKQQPQQTTGEKFESTAPVKGIYASGQYQADQLNQQLLQ